MVTFSLHQPSPPSTTQLPTAMSRPTTPLPTTAPSLSTRPPKDPSPSTFTAPPRSSTHPIKPRHHNPHHPHRVHHHHHRHRHDSNVPQSAIQPTLSLPFGDLLAKTTSSRDEAADNTLAREKEERERQKQKLEQETQERAQWAQVEKMRAKRTAADESVLPGYLHKAVNTNDLYDQGAQNHPLDPLNPQYIHNPPSRLHLLLSTLLALDPHHHNLLPPYALALRVQSLHPLLHR